MIVNDYGRNLHDLIYHSCFFRSIRTIILRLILYIIQIKTPLRALGALLLAIAAELSTPIVTADKILAKSAENKHLA
jgi:hypothetical protein